MPSRSSSRSSSSGRSSGLFGRSAPSSGSSRGYSTATAAPSHATTHKEQPRSHAMPPAVPHNQQIPHAQTAHNPHQQQHAYAAQPQAQGGMLSGIMGGVVQGMAFGGGSAIAHRAVDGVFGPREVVHTHQNNDANANNSSTAAPLTAATSNYNNDYAAADNGQCRDDLFQFNKCMTDNNNNFNQCSFMYDILSQCRRNVAENKQWQ